MILRSLCLLALFVPIGFTADQNQSMEGVFAKVRSDENALRAFFSAMPKGGDLHHHLTGSPFAETFMEYAASQNHCFNPKTLAVTPGPCKDGHVSAKELLTNEDYHNELIDFWSLRSHTPGTIDTHRHFFGVFQHFEHVTKDAGFMLAMLQRRAAVERVSYLESSMGAFFGDDKINEIANQVTWNDNFDIMLQAIHSSRFEAILDDAVKKLQAARDRAANLNGCGEGEGIGCDVTVRFQLHMIRVLPKLTVFVQSAFFYALAERDPNIVGVNIVGPEDNPVALRDFDLHMRMLDFFHKKYPKVRRSFHAGELVPGLVRPEDLNDHIDQSIHLGHAERIGHGSDISSENRVWTILDKMRREGIAIELALTSNYMLLGLDGRNHPLPFYHQHGVPIVLATDDAGIFRTDLTEQFVLAAQWFPTLSYEDFKSFARNSLAYSFAPGEGLWSDPGTWSNTHPDFEKDKDQFLKKNLRARLQHRLEREFSAFEQQQLAR